jgi:hypothetical protein
MRAFAICVWVSINGWVGADWVGVVFDSDTHAGTGKHRHRDRNSVKAKYKRRVGEERRECSRSHLSEVRKGRGREEGERERERETGTSTEMRMTRET